MTERRENFIRELEEQKDEWLKGIVSAREMVLSNIALISQIPSETFREEERASFLLEHYIAGGFIEPSTDKLHNVIGIIHGQEPERSVLVYTHMDHQPGMRIDRSITITEQRVLGWGVPDDTLALAVLVTLPDIINRLKLNFSCNIVLLATTHSHGRGALGGLKHYLESSPQKPDYAINLAGIPLGTVDYISLSRVRCDINCNIGAELRSPWSSITNISANMIIGEIMRELAGIELPRQPKTVINIGKIFGGTRYSTVSTQAGMNVEVLSEDDAILARVIEDIHDRCVDVGARYDVDITTEFFGRYHAAGLSYSHPLVKTAVGILNALNYRPIMAYNNFELSIPLLNSIPTVSLAVSTGTVKDGSVDIALIPTGILQIIMLLHAIDRGYCDA